MMPSRCFFNSLLLVTTLLASGLQAGAADITQRDTRLHISYDLKFAAKAVYDKSAITEMFLHAPAVGWEHDLSDRAVTELMEQQYYYNKNFINHQLATETGEIQVLSNHLNQTKYSCNDYEGIISSISIVGAIQLSDSTYQDRKDMCCSSVVPEVNVPSIPKDGLQLVVSCSASGSGGPYTLGETTEAFETVIHLLPSGGSSYGDNFSTQAKFNIPLPEKTVEELKDFYRAAYRGIRPPENFNVGLSCKFKPRRKKDGQFFNENNVYNDEPAFSRLPMRYDENQSQLSFHRRTPYVSQKFRFVTPENQSAILASQYALADVSGVTVKNYSHATGCFDGPKIVFGGGRYIPLGPSGCLGQREYQSLQGSGGRGPMLSFQTAEEYEAAATRHFQRIEEILTQAVSHSEEQASWQEQRKDANGHPGDRL